ncbi:ferredoxin [Streptomyces sp. ICBB 8177]|uniref:ferredoxin n=1 Tax=Streptomyces sp. ICBB 8177 TaxID=563922 RepID=UPI000D67C335|nr:ferredoxin [Streptomyces sp. ICBB 8177]PWI42531.1 ferredoxin [Streptomyces sp. ICBB 8177]
MRVSVDRERCCGAGQCVVHAPDVFDQSEDDGMVVLLNERPSDASAADVRLAAHLCPAGAITVTEESAADTADA